MFEAPGKQAEAHSRVVLLGASNLARGMPAIIKTARRHLGGPIEFLVAAGLGRSYGQTSRFLTRERVGIARCGLWDELAIEDRAGGYALLADVGNEKERNIVVEKACRLAPGAMPCEAAQRAKVAGDANLQNFMRTQIQQQIKKDDTNGQQSQNQPLPEIP